MPSPALFSLAGHVAAVTGASSGIGRTIALALADAGAAVVLIARREDELDAARTDIERSGGRATIVPCDVADRVSVPVVQDYKRSLTRGQQLDQFA